MCALSDVRATITERDDQIREAAAKARLLLRDVRGRQAAGASFRRGGSASPPLKKRSFQGKLFKGSTAIVKRSDAMAFPKISVENLMGNSVELPTDIKGAQNALEEGGFFGPLITRISWKGAPALVLVSYRQYGFNQAKQWLEKLEPGAPDAIPGLRVMKLSIVEHTILR
eukprot:scaffold300_cov258-Pinguiococcus_pyrenoidosus.AAC.34